MAVHSLTQVQMIPTSLQEAWNFFSDPKNLSKLTPADMEFKIISEHHGEKMYAGQLIEYKVKPLFGIAVYWMTEITHLEDLKFFVDEQRYGPYSMWHHQHHFREVGDGVEMTDIVHYKIPYWFLGEIANLVVVKKKLHSIFEYRKERVRDIFG